MNTSESFKALPAALSKAQASMTGAKKSSNNPFFKSKYSDLSEVIKAISVPFADNGLSFVQSAGFIDGKISVTTRIMHESGEWLESDRCELPPVKNDPQAYGSAISYAKRYSLQALAGVPSVDDDSNEAAKQVITSKPINDTTAKKIKACKSLDDLGALWGGLDKEAHKKYATIKDEMKAKLAA